MLFLAAPTQCLQLALSLAVCLFAGVAFMTSACDDWLRVALGVLGGVAMWAVYQVGTGNG